MLQKHRSVLSDNSTNYVGPTSTQLGHKFEAYAAIGDTALATATNTAVLTMSVQPGSWLLICHVYCANGSNAQTVVYGAMSSTSGTNDDVGYQMT